MVALLLSRYSGTFIVAIYEQEKDPEQVDRINRKGLGEPSRRLFLNSASRKMPRRVLFSSNRLARRRGFWALGSHQFLFRTAWLGTKPLDSHFGKPAK